MVNNKNKLPADIQSILTKENIKKEFTKLQKFNHLYLAAIKEVKTKLEILDAEFEIKFNHNPIHHIETRLKSVDSIIGKLKNKDYDITVDTARNKLYDIAGIRVVCYYIDDVYYIAKVLLQQSDIKFIQAKDYIKNPKDNGYRSLHLIIEIPIYMSDGVENIPVEIQIRTVSMDCWASLEHELKYKKIIDNEEEVANELKKCAIAFNEIDNHMHKIRDMIQNDNNDDE